MNSPLRTALALAIVAGFAASVSAETIPLFDPTDITVSPDSGADIGNRFAWAENTLTVFCDGPAQASVQTVGGGPPIVDNYLTAGDDNVSICSGGGDIPDPIAGTNCFSSPGNWSANIGNPIESSFSGAGVTAPVSLSDGQNDITFKLWDFGTVYGNTGLELALPANCSSQPIPTYFNLCAAQFDDVGEIGVSNDSENLYVTFEILDPFLDWYIEETHVAVVADPADFPTAGKNNNPVPGQFPYECDEVGELAQYCVATIPLGDLSGDVYVAAHAAVYQLAGDGCGSETQYAYDIVSVNQGLQKNGNPIGADRSDPYVVRHADDGLFFSLGFSEDLTIPGGDLTVVFEYPVFNGPGNDICVQEVTFGRPSYPEELTEVYGDATLLDTVSNKANGTGLACVGIPETTPMVDDVTLVDVTDPAIHAANGDGYDVDWIGACYLYLGDETAWGEACPDDAGIPFTERGNWGTYFEYTIK